MSAEAGTRLAVWGDPIEHSRSPALHAAAYRALGLDWDYGRRRVDAEGFADAIAGLDPSWRGLSLTMPLKESARAWAADVDEDAELTGAVNTLLLHGEGAGRGFNTDVQGLVAALRENGLDGIRRARILGAGATARSMLVSLARLGAEHVEIRARRPERATPLLALGDALGLRTTVTGLDADASPVDLTASSLPSGTVLDAPVADALADGGALFDAAYAPWPSAIATAWRGGPTVSGLEMLLGQALLQVRVFLHGDPAAPLPDEAVVRGVMRAAAMGD